MSKFHVGDYVRIIGPPVHPHATEAPETLINRVIGIAMRSPYTTDGEVYVQFEHPDNPLGLAPGGARYGWFFPEDSLERHDFAAATLEPGTSDGLWAGDPSTDLVDLRTGELDRAVHETQLLADFARQVIRSGSMTSSSFSNDSDVRITGSFSTPVPLETFNLLQRVHSEEMREIFGKVGVIV